MGSDSKKIEYLVADTTAFIQNAQLQDLAEKVVTCQEVINEVTNSRQLKRLAALPYDLEVKNVFPENVKLVTEFSKKTGDYPSLSATDIKVMALTYQLEKEKVGVEHVRSDPVVQRSVNVVSKSAPLEVNNSDLVGFYSEGKSDEIAEKLESVQLNEELDENVGSDDVLVRISSDEEGSETDEEDDDDSGWITPSNIQQVKKQAGANFLEDKQATVACMTTDFAMQNVLKQMNLNVAALDGRLIKHLRTFILRCYSCFKTTSVMTHKFCPKCANPTLKKVAVSLDENGKMQIYINARRPLTGRGMKFSLPTFKGGKHPNNPIIAPDQPMPHNRPSRVARTKVNPLDEDYLAGFSPFAVRDVNSKSAMLGIRVGEVKHWMRKNPNEARRKRK